MSEHRPTLAEATPTWLRIGLLSFGGPAAQIATMHRILVEERRWIGETRFLHALNYCMLLPGPEAQQLATYIGWLMHRAAGGFVAGTLFILPGFLCMLALSAIYVAFGQVPFVAALFFGLKSAVLAIVVEAVIRIGRRALKTGTAVALAALAFIAIFFLDLPFPLIVGAAIAIGLFGHRLAPQQFKAGGHGKAEDGRPGIFDDVADHIAPSLARALRIIALFALLWFGPIVLIAWAAGWDSLFTTMAVFFSKMAVVTFGGAYAVLAYVAQQAVETHGWLAAPEMLDGLALAETTPGPLILVLQFVGFLAAARAGGFAEPLLGGLLGATLTVWVTFVPCFLWIFLGAPYVERLRRQPALAAALAAVTAAVVGVVLNLAIWFALHTLFHRLEEAWVGPLRLLIPQAGSIDLAALAITAVAFVLVFRLRWGMAATLAICAALGAAARLLL
jgi:chromate transporter